MHDGWGREEGEGRRRERAEARGRMGREERRGEGKGAEDGGCMMEEQSMRTPRCRPSAIFRLKPADHSFVHGDCNLRGISGHAASVDAKHLVSCLCLRM